MWVNLGIAVARKVLRAGKDAARTQAAMKCRTHLGDPVRITPKAAVLGDGTFQIHVQVEHRRKVGIATDGAKFQGYGVRYFLNERQVAKPAEFRRGGPHRERFLERESRTALLVNTDEDGAPRGLANGGCEFAQVLYAMEIPGKKGHTGKTKGKIAGQVRG